MKDEKKTKAQLITELSDLRQRVATLEATQTEYKPVKNETDIFKVIAEKANYGIGIIDLEGHLIYVNRSFAEMHGYVPDELTGQHFSITHPHRKSTNIKKLKKRLEPSGRLLTDELWQKKKDGTLFPALLTGTGIKDDKGKLLYFSSIAIDISELKQTKNALRESEQKLRALSSHLLTVQEKEKKRISLELHDELGQSLTVLKLRFRTIERKLNPDQEGLKETCATSLQYIDQIIDNVRRLSRDLSPSTLEDLGLSSSLRWMAEGFAKYCNIKLSIQTEDIDHLYPPENQIIIYRIFQEALTNIEKHAQAGNASIIVKKEKKNVTFTIEDNGQGFDAQKTVAGYSIDKGMGLAAIDERSRMLGGILDLSSAEGKGTRIRLTVPIG